MCGVWCCRLWGVGWGRCGVGGVGCGVKVYGPGVEGRGEFVGGCGVRRGVGCPITAQ